MARAANVGLITLIGRILLVLIFLPSGFGKIMAPEQTQGYMASKGMPLVPILFVAAIVIELAGGLAVILGFMTRWAAAALIVFLVVAGIVFHDFWESPPAEMQNQMIHFLKNVGMIGGLLLLIGFGPGPFSIDERRRRPTAAL